MTYFNNPITTVHTSRTIMFAELSKVMDHALCDDRYLESLNENVVNKLTKSNQKKTTGFLKQIYGFDVSFPPFICFKYFWQITDVKDRPILSLLYALCKDSLLGESISVIISTAVGEKVSKLRLEENIEAHHPRKFTNNTRSSATRNIISSWKQAGYIIGKVKNIRTQPNHCYHSVAFAFLMAYFNGDRGDFILSSKWVQALAISESQVRELANEAAKRDLLKYQYAGSVTTISFNNLFKKLNIDV